MNTERERLIRDPNSREAKIMQELNRIEDEIAAGEVSIFAVFTAMRQMIMREQAQLTEANRRGEELLAERAELGRLADKLGDDDESVFEEFIAKVNSLREKDEATATSKRGG